MSTTCRHRRSHGVAAAGRLALATAFVALFLLLPATPALAHAILLRSEPGDGTVLAQAPREVRLWFTERVAPELSNADLRDADGRSILPLRMRNDASQQGLVHIALPALQRGLYTVAWSVLSEDDGHSRRGLLVFRMGPGAKPAAAAAAGKRNPVSPLEAVLRWLDVAVLAALVGAVAVAGWVLTPSVTDGSARARRAVRRTRRRILGWGRMAAGVGLTLGIWILARQVAALAAGKGNGGAAAVTWKLLGQTRWGTLWIGRQALLLCLGIILVISSRAERTEPEQEDSRGTDRTLPVAAVLVAGLALLHVLAGHAGSESSNRALTVVAGTAHMLAAGLWVGGLLALLIAWPLWDGARIRSGPLMTAYLRRFGRLALLSVGLILTTGLFYAAQEVASLDALLTTIYGRALLGKTGLFLATGVFGLANAVLLHPRAATPLARLLRRPAGWTRLAPGRVRTLVVAEASLGLLVLAGAGLLGAAPPARGPQFAPASQPFPISLSRTVDDLLVTVSVRPNRPGANVFEVLVASTRRPPLAEVRQVSLRFTNMASGRILTSPRLSAVDPGRHRLSGDFLTGAGSWQIEAVVERSDLPVAIVPFDWRVADLVQPSPPQFSNRPLRPILTAASAAGILLILIVLGVSLARRSTRPRPRQPPTLAPTTAGDVWGVR
jgi:copper transport protein